MTKEYGVDLAPEPLIAAQTIILPTGAKEWAEKHLESFDAKKHNTKVVVAELLPIDAPCGLMDGERYREGATEPGRRVGGSRMQCRNML